MIRLAARSMASCLAQAAQAQEAQMRRMPADARRSAFSLIELLVSISIIAVLASLLLPALGTVKRAAQSIRCGGNLRQMAMAVLGYAQDNDGYLVSYRIGGVLWHDSLAPYAEADTASGSLNMNGSSVFLGCPAWNYPGAAHWTKLGYGMPLVNNKGTSRPFKSDWYWAGSEPIRDGLLGELTMAGKRILIGESAVKYLEASGNPARWILWNSYKYDQTLWSNPTATPPANPVRHTGRANYAFVDGHVQSLGPLTSPWGYLDPTKLSE